tara:strand:+ start:3579 stop:3725 length:147 start_codon:yes stop_codon:yes gene_type:complete
MASGASARHGKGTPLKRSYVKKKRKSILKNREKGSRENPFCDEIRSEL